MSIAIVAGGSSGIGQGAAVQLAKRGFGVILTYSRNKEGGLETQGTGKVAMSGCLPGATRECRCECGHGLDVIMRVSKSLITSGSPCPRCHPLRSLLPLTMWRSNSMR